MGSTDEALLRTPLYEEHRRAGAKLVPFAGWEMPIQYAGISEEHRAVRTAAGLFDVSHMGELVMTGEYAGQVVNYLITNDASKLSDGQALYTCCCNEAGTILDDLIVYRVAADRWLIVCNASNRAKIAAHFAKAAENHCTFEDVSDRTALIAFQGPKSLDVLSLVSDGAVIRGLGSFRFADIEVAGVKATVARTGYTGEIGVEIFSAPEDAPKVWQGLLEAGKSAGVAPVGLGARDTLRLEACLSLYGNDIDETTNPLEAGLSWTVKLDKGAWGGGAAGDRSPNSPAVDFVGRAALQAVKSAGLARKLVGFEMVGRGIARHGYAIGDANGEKVGLCTSGSPGPTVGKNIGLGYVPSSMSQVGQALKIDCRGKWIDAVVVKTPFYKRSA